MNQIGRSVPRREGRAKVTGHARYVDDFALPGMLHGVTVRSTVPRGRILGIDFDPAIPWDEFTIVTAADVPGKNRVALIPRNRSSCWRIAIGACSKKRGATCTSE